MRIASTSTFRRRSPLVVPRPYDVICHTRTRAARGAAATGQALSQKQPIAVNRVVHVAGSRAERDTAIRSQRACQWMTTGDSNPTMASWNFSLSVTTVRRVVNSV